MALAAIFIFLAAACKKKGSGVTADPENPTVPTVPKTPGQELKTVVPISLTSDGTKIEFTYAASKNLISEIKQSTGSRELIQYNDSGYPKKYERFLKDELVYQVSYVTNEQGLVTKGLQHKAASGGKVLTLLGNYQISYNDNLQISEVNWYDFRGNLTTSHQYSYDDKQYLKSKTTAAGTPSSYTYTYDDKSGLVKNVAYTQLLSIENEGFYLLNNHSNISSIQNADHTSGNLRVVNQYNADNYPATITVTDLGNQNKTYKVTYR